ncbi:Protein SOK1 [Apiospora sp. TS-2023a]
MGDQGIDSGMERNRRLSEPSQKTHDDQIQQQKGAPETPSTETEEATQYAQNDHPRRMGAPNGTLSRNPSTGSNTSENLQSRLPRSEPRKPQRSPAGPPSASQRIEPPVTKTTLSELDVNKIIHNPKLRHDINFDPELHFRPNLDGEKGRRKQVKADQFWTSLRDQLQQFVADPVSFQQRYGQGQGWCLPVLLKAVKEIIQTLVPSRDRVYLDEGLNVDLIMQQFHRGIADLEKLASWLSGVLKSHCAPMRDEWVDEMYNQLTNGNRTNDMEELVQGMRSLLSVLEAMKLDVANHQIRCLRPILIEDTVKFEKRFFYKKIQGGKLDPQIAQHWYAVACHELLPGQESKAAFGEMAVFFEALSKLILPSNMEQLPNTFLFDEERMFKLRADMLDHINLEICMRLYEELEKNASGFISSSSSDDDASSFNFNTPPTSRPSSLVFSSAGSASSSPRSSMVLPANSLTAAADARTKSKNLHSSLVALLQTSPTSSRPAHKWKAMKDSLALQIFRFTDAPSDVLLQFEDELERHLCEPDSQVFQEVERHFHDKLLAELQQRVRDLKPLTGVGLFSVATGGRINGSSRAWEGSRDHSMERDTSESSTREAREEGGIEDMATRLTHLGLLHWRVWSSLVYDGDYVDTEMADSLPQ